MAVASGFGAGSIAAAVSMDWSLLDVEVPGCSRLHLVVAVMQPVLTGCQEHFTVNMERISTRVVGASRTPNGEPRRKPIARRETPGETVASPG